MQVDTHSLTGITLSYATALARGFVPADIKTGVGHFPAKDPENAKYFCNEHNLGFRQSTYQPAFEWNQAGVVLDKFEISVIKRTDGLWGARYETEDGVEHESTGKNAIEACLRVLVVSVFGQQMDIPERLVIQEIDRLDRESRRPNFR